jgi:hypothetical protein
MDIFYPRTVVIQAVVFSLKQKQKTMKKFLTILIILAITAAHFLVPFILFVALLKIVMG